MVGKKQRIRAVHDDEHLILITGARISDAQAIEAIHQLWRKRGVII